MLFLLLLSLLLYLLFVFLRGVVRGSWFLRLLQCLPLVSGLLPFWLWTLALLLLLFLVSSSLSVAFWGALGFAAVADPVSSVAPVVSSSLFCPFDAPAAVPSGVVPLSSLPHPGSFSVFSSAPLSGVPPPLAAPLCSYFSSFAPFHAGPSFPDDSGFDLGFADPSSQAPELPLAPPVPDSVRAEIRRMYAYVVDLFLQAAPPPPWALFQDFFVAFASSPRQPVFLDWFARVRTALSEADARLASLMASGRPDSSLLPQRLSQYAVHGDFASSAAVSANPSLLSYV